MKIMFIPHNAYHARNMSFVVPYLQAAGTDYLFVDLAEHYHREGSGEEIRRLGLNCENYTADILKVHSPDAVVVMNDWGGVVSEQIREANRAGIPTVCIVEGTQDFEDTHVAHIGVGGYRRPYRHAKYPLLIGEYDRKFIKSRLARVVGMPRVEQLCREEPVFPEKPLVAINCNFTYGVYTNIQRDWVESAVGACRAAGLDYVITQHHADKMDLSGYNKADGHIHDVLRSCSVLASRFSTCLLESMALGKPVVYHNPHGERVDTFQEPMGAFRITTDEAGLAEALKEASAWKDYRGICRRFFEYHVSVSETPSGKRIADALLGIPELEKGYKETLQARVLRKLTGRLPYSLRDKYTGFFL